MENKEKEPSFKKKMKEQLYLEMLQQNLLTLNTIESLIFKSDKDIVEIKSKNT